MLDSSYNVLWEPQVALLKPFAALLKRDKSKDKAKATKEMAFIFFYCDIRSDYMIHIDPKTREEAIKADLGLPANWKLDKQMTAAIDFYKNMSRSVTANILEHSTYVANKVASKLKEAVDQDDLDVTELDKLLGGLKKIPEVIRALKAAEKEVLKEIAEAQDSLGSKEKALFEDMQLYDKKV